jgi:hypothetical protein
VKSTQNLTSSLVKDEQVYRRTIEAWIFAEMGYRSAKISGDEGLIQPNHPKMTLEGLLEGQMQIPSLLLEDKDISISKIYPALLSPRKSLLASMILF